MEILEKIMHFLEKLLMHLLEHQKIFQLKTLQLQSITQELITVTNLK